MLMIIRWCNRALDEVDEPLTKSESSDEVTTNQQSTANEVDTVDGGERKEPAVMHGMNGDSTNGTFTNTIKSKEFQQYLDKKGLTLIPKKIPNGAQSVYTNGMPRPNTHISFRVPERVQFSIDTMDEAKGGKKPSVFQRLLANSIFASRRRTTPKETVPTPKQLHDSHAAARESSLKRVVLERQSFHGRPRAGNLLSEFEATDLRSHPERTRKSYASGDDLSVSISSALTNAEYAVGSDIAPAGLRKSELQTKPIAKPPRRTLSRDRLGNVQQLRQAEPQDAILKPKVQRAQMASNTLYTLPPERAQRHGEVESDGPYLKRSLERQSLIPKRTTQAADKRQVFGRSASMDRNEILKRNAARGLQNRSRSTTGTLKAPTNGVSCKENVGEPQNGPQLTSTPVREATAKYEPSFGTNMDTRTFAPISNNLAKPATGVYVGQQEWERLRAMKERTDRELYYKVLQQQQQQQLQQQQFMLQQQQQIQLQQERLQQQELQQQHAENIYEHLQSKQVLMSPPLPSRAAQQQQQQQERKLLANGDFVRGSPQRNTFSGVIRNRQVKIIDGRAVLATEATIPTNNPKAAEPTMRSQSVLDGMTQATRMPGLRRGYESDTETPVVMRRKQASGDQAPPRRIGGILTREEVLQKVKEFCRKSLNKTPTNQPPLQAIYEKQHIATDLSPVSYVSVETHQRPGSRIFVAPQVPQRMQSLPEQFVPIAHEIIDEQNVTTASPVYAHVVKRSSLQSNPSELYESPPRSYLVRRDSDAQTIYVSRGTLPRPELAYAQQPQYVIVDGDKITPAQVLNYSQADLYTQPQYIRPHQLQPVPGAPGAYGYITVREPVAQQLRPRLHDGRSTPLILDRSSQQASQIYWTPQHQQHAGLLPIEISPRYTLQQAYPVPVPATRTEQISRATRPQAAPPTSTSIPNQQRQKSSTIARMNSPNNIQQHNQQQQQQQQPQQLRPIARQLVSSSATEYNAPHPAYEWESGSEAGEVQRIMEHQKNSGEFKSYNILKNLRAKVARLVRGSRR